MAGAYIFSEMPHRIYDVWYVRTPIRQAEREGQPPVMCTGECVSSTREQPSHLLNLYPGWREEAYYSSIVRGREQKERAGDECGMIGKDFLLISILAVVYSLDLCTANAETIPHVQEERSSQCPHEGHKSADNN